MAFTRGTWWVLLLTAPAALLFGQVGFLAHDATHNQILNTSRANYVLSVLLFNLCLGGSRGWWAERHNTHHAQPNRLGVDPDIEGGVVAVTADQAREATGFVRFMIRHQGGTIAPLLSLSALQIRAYSALFIRARSLRHPRVELGLFAAHYALYFTGLVLVLGVGGGLLFAAVHQLLLGLYLGGAFLPNHFGMTVLKPGDRLEFLPRQVVTSRNLKAGRVTDYFFGPLGAQIEHHLFPAMPRHNLRKAGPSSGASAPSRGSSTGRRLRGRRSARSTATSGRSHARPTGWFPSCPPTEQRHRPAGRGWSGRLDSNQRPPAPKAGALPGCATPRRPQSIGARAQDEEVTAHLRTVDLLDAVILLLAASGLYSGYRRGISWVGPSLIGLVIGILVGAAAAPPLAAVFTKQANVQPLVTSGLFLGMVLIIQGVGTALGFRARVRTLRTRFAQVDSALGAILATLGVLAGSWYLGLTFSQSPWTALDNQISGSAIEKALDGIAPRPPGFLATLENALRDNSFPNPFSAIAPIAPAPAAIPPLVDTPGIRAARAATSKVIAFGCGGAEAGSSWPIGQDDVVTNAHVVAGSQRVEVDTTDGATHPATVVFFDPDIDVAVLHVPGLGEAALPTATTDPARGVTGAAIGYPGGQDEKVVAAEVRGTEEARGYNIYNSNLVTRDIEVLAATIIPGNSGGPIVDTAGVVQGLVFAASTTNPDEGYALTMTQIAGDIQQGRGHTQEVSTQGCTNG